MNQNTIRLELARHNEVIKTIDRLLEDRKQQFNDHDLWQKIKLKRNLMVLLLRILDRREYV